MEQNTKNVSALSNEMRNSYVLNQITEAMIDLLKEKEMNNISISELCDKAQIGRTSFYRNFDSKEAIVEFIIERKIDEWDSSRKKESEEGVSQFFGQLTGHLKENEELYLLLEKRGLLQLLLNVLIKKTGPTKEDSNIWAYTKAFIAYGTFGWLQAWISRGMQESAEEMTQLLLSSGYQK